MDLLKKNRHVLFKKPSLQSSTIITKIILLISAIQPVQAAPRDQGARESCKDWHCFNLSLLPQSAHDDNRADNHWFLISQVQKIGVLQVVVYNEDACDGNGKLSNPSSLIPSNFCHYFHILLTSSQELTFPWKPVT